MLNTRFLFSIFAALLLSACGGGGGSGGSSQSQTNNQVRTPALVNVNSAFNAIYQLNTTYHSLPSNDGSLYTASLIIENDEVYPFVSGGVSKATSISKRFQLHIRDASARLRYKYIWKLHLDANGKPLGLATSNDYFNWSNRLCLTSSSNSDLPTSSNGSGLYFVGDSGTYNETFRSGTYAHYCDTAISSTQETVSWNVADGDPNSYACVVFPRMLVPKTQICFATNANGVLSGSPWIRIFHPDGSPWIDYKDT